MEVERKNLTELLEEVIKIIENEPQSIEDIERIYALKERLDKALLSLLEYHLENYKEKSSNTKLRDIYAKVSKENVSSILESLTNAGYRFRNELGEDFRKMGYRILEQIRAGRRSDIEYSITRIFVTNGKNIPDILIEAFKPRYDDDTFKAFMYAFIGSVIKPKETKEED